MSSEVLADRHYWLDAEGNVTTDEAKSHIWLVREGSPIPAEVADKYGIGKVTPQAEGTADTVEEKAAQPKANKAERPSKNKGAK